MFSPHDVDDIERANETPTAQQSSGVSGYKDALDAIEKAFAHVFALCDGREKWTMRVPVDEQRDSDCIIVSALTKAKRIIESL